MGNEIEKMYQNPERTQQKYLRKANVEV